MEDPKQLLKALQGLQRGEKKKGSMYYLPTDLDKRFRKVCGDGNASRVLEALIRNFLEEVERDGKRR